MGIENVEKAVEAFKRGEFVIIVDDESRENEGDLVIAAERITLEAVNFMAREARGLICVPMQQERLAAIGSEPMTNTNREARGCAFEVSVDAKLGITTGISAADRARTIKLLADPATGPADFVRPGHIFPLRAKPGGVLHRTGHTEAAVDLAQLAGFSPCGAICEIMNPDGSMARRPELEEFAQRHGLLIITVEELVEYRRHHEKLVEHTSEADFPTAHGHFRIHGYLSLLNNAPYIALVKGVMDEEPTLVRVHSGCLTGDCLFSARCDCGEQLELAMRIIEAEGKGVILYIPEHEGRGIGILNKLRAYRLQDEGEDTIEANHDLGFPSDLRDFGIGAQVLADLGLRKLRLMTNNPKKLVGLSGWGLELVERVPLEVAPNEHNLRYLNTKRERMGHSLELGEHKEERA